MARSQGRSDPRGGGDTPPPKTRPELVLKVTEGPAAGRERTVPPDRSFTLGRSEEAEFPIVDGKISRLHCCIDLRDGEWVLEDLESRNGTWVKGTRVARHVLQDGDIFLLGKVTRIAASLRPAKPEPAAGRRVVFPRSAPDPAPAPIPAPEPLPPLEGPLVGLPGTNLGEFRIIEQVAPLGEAAFFRALQPSLNRHVMVEVFTDEQMAGAGGPEALQAGVRAVARLLHPNILQIYDFGSARGFTYVTMELFQGRNLGRILGEKGFVPLGQALALARTLCEVFSVAVDGGVPAGEISPGDVWVAADFAPKVKFFREPGAPPAPVIHYAYRAPEVLAGGDAGNPRSVVYTAGALLYHMLAATPPVSGKSREEIARRARHDTPTPLRRGNIKVTATLARVVEQALAKDPRARQESLRDLSRDLQRATAPTL